jgi:site-specific DNA-methyltransferase (adenine-specific)
MNLAEAIRQFIKAKNAPVHIQELYAEFPEAHEHSIRGRIYENLGKDFKRVGRGLYVAVQGDATCIVVQGDALEEVRKLESESIDGLVTDPPYDWIDQFREKKTTSWKRMECAFERRDIDLDLGRELYRVLREGAHAFIFVPAETGTTRPHINRMIDTLEKCGFIFRKRFIWDKLSIGMGYSGRARHEGILFLTRGNTKRRPCDLAVGDVIASRMIDPRKRVHPTEKPLGVLESLIRFATNVGEIVLDVFGGSCSTGKAAIRIGRNAICVEKDLEILERALAPIR